MPSGQGLMAHNLKEMTMYPNHAEAQDRKVGQIVNAARIGETMPVSPVQAQLQRQRELLSELNGGANALIDPLRTVLSHDPREAKGLATGAEPGQPPSCDLEMELLQANSALDSAIQRLREIRNAIRL